GRHPTRAGVRLADVALLLQHCHVVTHRRGRDIHVVTLDERPATHRLLGRHVVLHDGAQHLQLALVEGHVSPPPARSPARRSPHPRVPASGPGVRRGANPPVRGPPPPSSRPVAGTRV